MIDYKIINESIVYYESYNFKRIETPWLISKASEEATKPINGYSYIVNNNKRLPASGEQSYIELLLLNNLSKGCYQTITPCFRNDSLDLIHKEYFIKNELIITDLSVNLPLARLYLGAKRFFEKYLGQNTIEIKKTEEGVDLLYNNIELGSYGYRKYGNLEWYYGTGVAEPRFSTTLSIYGIS